MKLRSVLIISALSVSAVFTAAFTALSENGDSEKCITFLARFGWQTESEPNAHDTVNIPLVFDEVYKSYNEMQLEAGLDLTPYAGKSGTRFTFTVTNYPTDTGEPVYADVIVIDGEPVAGDIMTVSVHGFMHSLAVNAPPDASAGRDTGR